MTYYWIVAKHTGKVLEVEGSSINSARIIQYPKKSENSPHVSFALIKINDVQVCHIFVLYTPTLGR